MGYCKNKLISTLLGHRGIVSSVTWSYDGRLIASGSFDKTIMLWDAYAHELINTLNIGCSVSALDWSPTDGNLLIGCSDRFIRRIDSFSPVNVERFDRKAGRGGTEAIAWSPDGKTAAASGNGKVLALFDARRGKKLTEIYAYNSGLISNPSIGRIQFLPGLGDKKILALKCYHTISLWRWDKPEMVAFLDYKQSPNRSAPPHGGLTFDREGSILATQDDDSNDIYLWPTDRLLDIEKFAIISSTILNTPEWVGADDNSERDEIPVFISHASPDRDAAEAICTAVENRGLRCWMAARDIRPGENFQISIVRAIRKATIMLLVFSSHAKNSEEVKKELVLASQNRLVVIPLRIEDVMPDEAFEYEFATRQWIDMFNGWEQAIQRLCQQLSRVAGIHFRRRP